jgi:hypothetical protein
MLATYYGMYATQISNPSTIRAASQVAYCASQVLDAYLSQPSCVFT